MYTPPDQLDILMILGILAFPVVIMVIVGLVMAATHEWFSASAGFFLGLIWGVVNLVLAFLMVSAGNDLGWDEVTVGVVSWLIGVVLFVAFIRLYATRKSK